MSHLDEGLLTELIDNELSEAERQSAEAHLAECGECRRVLEELKAFALEADGLVAAVEVPPRTAVKVVPLTPLTAADQPRWGMHRWRTYAWAASVVLALGLGWAASDLRYAGPGEQGQLLEEKERAESAPGGSDAPSTPAPEPAPPATASTNAASPAQAPRNRAAGAPAEARRENKAAAQSVVAAEADGRAGEKSIPSRPSSQPPVAAKLAQDAAGAMDSVGIASFGDASVTASPAATLAPGARSQEGLMARRSMAEFRQVAMEEAVRTLGGSIRLMDGLEARRILVGPGSLTSGTDPSVELVRVVYEDPPGRELWLDQQPPPMPEVKLGAGYAALPGDTITTRDRSGPFRVRWVDERGFRLALTGYLATDSLRAMIHRVH